RRFHWEKPRSTWIVGRATFTIATSRITMKKAAQRAARPSHFRRWVGSWPVVAFGVMSSSGQEKPRPAPGTRWAAGGGSPRRPRPGETGGIRPHQPQGEREQVGGGERV